MPHSILANKRLRATCKNCDWDRVTHQTKKEAQAIRRRALLHVHQTGHYVDYSETLMEIIAPGESK